MWAVSEVIIKWIGLPLDQYEINQTFVFLFVNSLLEITLSTPFRLYSSFVIEERHGFNNQVQKQTLHLLLYCFVFHAIHIFPDLMFFRL